MVSWSDNRFPNIVSASGYELTSSPIWEEFMNLFNNSPISAISSIELISIHTVLQKTCGDH